MLMPAPPSAGPTGGAGVPFPAGMFSLMFAVILFAICRLSWAQLARGKRHRGRLGSLPCGSFGRSVVPFVGSVGRCGSGLSSLDPPPPPLTCVIIAAHSEDSRWLQALIDRTVGQPRGSNKVSRRTRRGVCADLRLGRRPLLLWRRLQNPCPQQKKKERSSRPGSGTPSPAG